MYHDGRNIPVMSGQIQEGKNLVMEEKNGVTGTGNMGFLPSPPPPVTAGQSRSRDLDFKFPSSKMLQYVSDIPPFSYTKNMHIVVGGVSQH
jgi:hypothetical protein